MLDAGNLYLFQTGKKPSRHALHTHGVVWSGAKDMFKKWMIGAAVLAMAAAFTADGASARGGGGHGGGGG